MKKFVLASVLSLISFSIHSVNIDEKWQVNDVKFEFRHVDFNVEILTELNNIARVFHEKDEEARGKQAEKMGEENFARYLKLNTKNRMKGVEQKTESAVVLYRDGEIVGGCYYTTEPGLGIVRVTLAGYNEDKLLPGTEENIRAKMNSVLILSSKKYFPMHKKLIFMVRNGSINMSELFALGFVEAPDYEADEFPKPDFIAFEKLIVAAP